MIPDRLKVGQRLFYSQSRNNKKIEKYNFLFNKEMISIIFGLPNGQKERTNERTNEKRENGKKSPP